MIEPVSFASGTSRLFGMLHRPDGDAQDAGVVICAPIGLENVCAYRPLRELARQLAAAGRPTLRFDLPAIGDSSGQETDADLVRSWVAAVRDAVRELRSRAEVATVAVVGVRLGATLAALAAEKGAAIDELVLWAPLPTGRAYVRETRAFHGIAEREFLRPDHDVHPLPDGAVEASGFLLAAETVRDLAAVDLTTIRFAGRAPRRVLIADRTVRRGDDDPLVTSLREDGAAMETTVFDGLDDVVSISLDGAVPQGAFDAILDWLSPGAAVAAQPTAEAGGVTMELEHVHETAELLRDARDLFTITTLPTGGPAGDQWVVFVNTSGARRIGPNRMWTRFARELAVKGIPSIRFDVTGSGDSEGPFSATLETMYDPQVVQDTRDVLAHLRARHGARSFVAVGLCSGGYTGLHAAEVEPDISGVMLVNPQTLYWTPETAAERERYVRLSPLNRGRWHRLLTGRVGIATMLRASTQTLVVWLSWLRRRHRAAAASVTPSDQRLREVLHTPLARGCKLLFAFAKGNAGIDYLEWKLGPELDDLLRSPNMRLEVVAGPDHTFRPLWAHDVLLGLLEDHLRICGVTPAHG